MNSLLVQVLTVGISIAIIFTYIKPTMAEISTRQDEIKNVEEEILNVDSVNSRLSEVYAQLLAVPQSHRVALTTYLPVQIDDLKVMKELTEIANRAQLIVSGISADSSLTTSPVVAPETESELTPLTHTYKLSFQSSYQQFKEALRLIEKNNYPLVVKKLDVKPSPEGLVEVDLELETYALPMAKVATTISTVGIDD